jgi:uncharacterized GH25 family protein
MKTLMICSTIALAAFLPLAASAHKTFLVPSTTVLAGSEDEWITVDAAVSNDLFYFNHHALALDQLVIVGPDGAKIAPENASTGKWRSTFDVHLTHAGTYKIEIGMDGLFGNYVDAKGEKKRWRGSADKLKEIPADAKNLEISQMQSTIDTFVTLGKPSDGVLKSKGSGLEFVPVTHPNDLFWGEKASFRFLLDGKPAAGVKISVLAGGTRYRDNPGEITATTDARGEFAVTWPSPGMYWLNASMEDQKATVPQAKGRRLGYTATLEVLPQ